MWMVSHKTLDLTQRTTLITSLFSKMPLFKFNLYVALFPITKECSQTYRWVVIVLPRETLHKSIKTSVSTSLV